MAFQLSSLLWPRPGKCGTLTREDSWDLQTVGRKDQITILLLGHFDGVSKDKKHQELGFCSFYSVSETGGLSIPKLKGLHRESSA